MDQLRYLGKKILILGGATMHIKLVQAAKDLGAYTIITDYLPVELSPCKRIADEHWEIDIFDVELLVQKCIDNGVDAVLSTSLDPCQMPYQQICHKLGVHCYCTEEQVIKLSNKNDFKSECKKYGVDIILEYSTEDIFAGNEEIKFPVFVKPVRSRGSRGQRVCYSCPELLEAVSNAKNISEDGDAIIEKFMENFDDFTMTILMVNGKAHILRMADRYLGSKETEMNRNCIASIAPSKYSKLYTGQVHERIERLLNGIGMENGPVFMQGFVDGNKIRFYDPGCRFPGAEHELVIDQLMGVNIPKMMVEFAFEGKFSDQYGKLNDTIPYMKGKVIATLVPTIKSGVIKRILGISEISSMPEVSYISQRHFEGDEIKDTYDISQTIGEFYFQTDSLPECRNVIKRIKETLHIEDQNGENMLISPFDESKINEYAFGRG